MGERTYETLTPQELVRIPRETRTKILASNILLADEMAMVAELTRGLKRVLSILGALRIDETDERILFGAAIDACCAASEAIDKAHTIYEDTALATLYRKKGCHG